MRRSVRRSVPSTHKMQDMRAPSPSASESTFAATPSTSPSPESLARQCGPPGLREDGTSKRPMNAFILFSNEKRSELADLNPHLSNAAVSVLLGQSWRDMAPTDKACYVAAAKKIKEDFVAANPDAKRGTGRKNKRKLEGGAAGSASRIARNMTPPSLHALALVGSRLNQDPPGGGEYAPQHYAPPHHAAQHYAAQHYTPPYAAKSDAEERSSSPSLLDQLCVVAENEHTAAAEMLSSLSAF